MASKPVSRKRRIRRSDDEDPNVLDEEQRASLKQRKTEPRYACPYYKNDPAKFGYRITCRVLSWPSIHGVKEHLCSSHRQAKQCMRCWTTFLDDNELNAHTLISPPCDHLDERLLEGCDEEQETELRSRKGSSKMTDTEKWRKLYLALFPDVAYDEIPDPYHEDASTFPPVGAVVPKIPALPRIVTIDLSLDDDGDMVKDVKQQEVCFGQVQNATIILHSVPSPKPDCRAVNDRWWPQVKIMLNRRQGDPSNLIHVRDYTRKVVGRIDDDTALGLAPLIDHASITLRTESRLSSRPRRLGEEVGQPMNVVLPLICILYGPRKTSRAVARHFLSRGLNLISPTTMEEGYKLENPFEEYIQARASPVRTQVVPDPLLPDYGTVPDPSPAPMLRHDNEKAPRVEASNSYTRTNMDADTPSGNEFTGSRETKEDDVPYTDSGYESVRGLDNSLMQEKGHEQSGRVEHGDSYTTSDVDDTKTSYSDYSTSLQQAAANKCVVDICNKISSRLERSVNKRSFILLSRRLPDLIKAFAVQLGSEMPDQSNLRVMHFVHKQHRYIVSQLENNFHDDEHESTCLRKSSDAMPLQEIISKWSESDHKEEVVVPPSEIFQGLSDEEDDRDGESVDEERDISASSEYYQMIVKSAAYEWLISSMVKEASFHWDEAQPRTMVDQIRQEILSQLPTGRISSKRPPNQHTASFKIPRSSLPFLSEDSRPSSNQNSAKMIADWIVATSSSDEHIQLSKVSQYMDQTWPLGGGALLSVLQNFINGVEKARTSSDVGACSEIEIMLDGFYLEAIITGTSYCIAQYGEQLAWLVAALQPAVSDLAMYIRPFIRRVHDHTPARDNRPSWSIELWREGIDDVDVTARSAQEWQGESKKPVIVRGFPTMIRPQNCPGIEVPPQFPANLLPSPFGGWNGTRFLLNPTGKVLQLFEKIKGVTVWHILSSPKEVCTCRRRFLMNNNNDSPPRLDPVELWKHRHIITKCSVAELHYRDSLPQMESGNGSAEITQRECPLSETPHFTPNSEDTTDSSDSLDVDMLSIPDSAGYGEGGPPDTDVAIMEVVASRLVAEYRQCTKQNSPPNECPSNAKQCSPGGQQSFSTHGSLHSTLGQTTTQAGSTIPVRKRPAEQDDDEGDEDSQRRPARKKKKGDSIKGPQFFACPFWKQNPGKHSNCFGKKLNMISRVKQHLTRSHSPEFYCEKCLIVFPNEEGKLSHFREELYLCTFQRSRPLEGITNEQQRKLSRKSDKSLSEYEKWFVVWDIVFPGHDRPSSPYLDLELSRDLNHFREFSERRGAAVLVEVMREEGLMTLEDNDADLMAQRAANRAMRLLFHEWVGHRAESSRNFGSGESSSTDAMEEQQYQGQHHERLQRLADLSSNADSGVELRSYPSSGPSRDGANVPRHTSIQPRLTSDRGPQIAAPALNNSGDATIRVPSIGANQPQLFNEPVPIETAHVDTATQSGEIHFDHQSLNPGSGTEWAGDLNLGFDMNDFFMNPDGSGFRSS